MYIILAKCRTHDEQKMCCIIIMLLSIVCLKVIGLDMYGYGRILGQCVYSSKIYYCLWLHLSKPTDPFVIKPYTRCSEEDKIAIKNEIIGKTDKEISEVS